MERYTYETWKDAEDRYREWEALAKKCEEERRRDMFAAWAFTVVLLAAGFAPVFLEGCL